MVNLRVDDPSAAAVIGAGSIEGLAPGVPSVIASGSTADMARDYVARMGTLPLGEYDWRSIYLSAYLAAALLGVALIVCVMCRNCARSRLAARRSKKNE